MTTQEQCHIKSNLSCTHYTPVYRVSFCMLNCKNEEKHTISSRSWSKNVFFILNTSNDKVVFFITTEPQGVKRLFPQIVLLRFDYMFIGKSGNHTMAVYGNTLASLECYNTWMQIITLYWFLVVLQSFCQFFGLRIMNLAMAITLQEKENTCIITLKYISRT